MDNLEIAKALFGNSGNASNSRSGGQTTTAYGIATSDSVNGSVRVNLGGETTSTDDDQTIEVDTTFAVYEGDEVIISLVGADGTGKAPCVIGVVGRGDQQQTEINSVTNYVWNDAAGLHVSTEERSVQGANILLDSDSLEIRDGASNSEADQTVYASFGREVTVGSRGAGTVGQYSYVFGQNCIASGDFSYVSGTDNTEKGLSNHVEGVQNTVTETESPSHVTHYNHVEGTKILLTDSYAAHVEGYENTVSGSRELHVEGSRNTVTNVEDSHISGYQNTVSNVYQATVEGFVNTVTGTGSHTEGGYNINSSNFQHVQGIANAEDPNNVYADIIGNGTVVNQAVTSRSNAYNMDWNGNAEFQGEVYVGGCTPNGETPYPVVRYNTSSAQQEYYDKTNSTWTQISGGGGGGSSWTLLWTNPNPSSTFAAQTIPINLSSWHLIAILAKPQETGSTTSVFLAAVGTDNILSVPNIGSTQYFYKRNATISSSGITFSTGYRNTNGTTGTGYCIPTAVYGLA